jgi:hypothetical protein
MGRLLKVHEREVKAGERTKYTAKEETGDR